MPQQPTYETIEDVKKVLPNHFHGRLDVAISQFKPQAQAFLHDHDLMSFMKHKGTTEEKLETLFTEARIADVEGAVRTVIDGIEMEANSPGAAAQRGGRQ